MENTENVILTALGIVGVENKLLFVKHFNLSQLTTTNDEFNKVVSSNFTASERAICGRIYSDLRKAGIYPVKLNTDMTICFATDPSFKATPSGADGDKPLDFNSGYASYVVRLEAQRMAGEITDNDYFTLTRKSVYNARLEKNPDDEFLKPHSKTNNLASMLDSISSNSSSWKDVRRVFKHSHYGSMLRFNRLTQKMRLSSLEKEEFLLFFRPTWVAMTKGKISENEFTKECEDFLKGGSNANKR